MRVLLLIGLMIAASAARADVRSTWVEAVGDGLSARAIASGGCPSITIDGKSQKMTPREAADTGFPLATCQATVSRQARDLSVDGTALPGWKPDIRRIVVIGDTGCRLKGANVQDCNDTVAWPFATIAARAAAEHPDLIVHVGDYYYRETPCPAARSGCAGSPYGDAWPAWQADFFDPVKPLLTAAPWIFVRGNHEQCGRGALGWFRFLDAGETPSTCPAASAPFTVALGRLHLFVTDSADAEDQSAPADKVALYHSELQRLSTAAGQGWILTHRPIWGFVPEGAGEVGETDEMPVNRTEQAAAAGLDLGGVQLILSGHVHLFAAASFGAARPAQLIVGNGGDTRDGDLAGVQAHRVSIAGDPADAFVIERFGYFVFDRTGDHWTGSLRDPTGRTMASCRLADRKLACTAAS